MTQVAEFHQSAVNRFYNSLPSEMLPKARDFLDRKVRSGEYRIIKEGDQIEQKP